MRNTCSRWKCENHILCDGIHRSCYERGNCMCWLYGCPKSALKNYCYLCLSEEEKYHAIFPCGHSMACIDCYKEECPFISPDAFNYGATESEDDDEALYCENGKWAKRDIVSWRKCMSADEKYEADSEKWCDIRNFKVCHVCKV